MHIVLVILLGFATAVVLAKTIAFQPCSVSTGNATIDCVVHEVRIAPCKEITSQGYCYVPRGQRVSFSYDFTPNFSGGALQTNITWKHLYQDLPLDRNWYDLNPCNSTGCPVTAGTRQTYNRTFTTYSGEWPNNYKLQSRLWNADNKYCCFTFKIYISR